MAQCYQFLSRPLLNEGLACCQTCKLFHYKEPRMLSAVSSVPAAPSDKAAAHFARAFEYETDCWDVHDALARGARDFVLFDVRSHALYNKGHLPGAISMPHAKIVPAKLSAFPADALFVVYCAGPHCNGAHRGALRLAQLGRSVKMMIGGITGWLDEGFALSHGEPGEPDA
jgi:rhodanese-related sulfurtransferase